MLAVNCACRVVILLHYRTFQGQAGEHALRAGVTQNFGIQLPVGSCRGLTAYRAGRNRSVSAKFELAGEKMLQTTVVHDQHNQVHFFDSDLQSPAFASCLCPRH